MDLYTLQYICLITFAMLVIYVKHRRNYQADDRICVVVLGDIGRSPRMLYHSLSLADMFYHVDIVGYKGARPHDAILSNEWIALRYIPQLPNFLLSLPRIMTLLMKPIYQCIVLFFVLLNCDKPKALLIQNPPSIPTLLVCIVVSWLQQTKLIIDWHNYGHTILALSLGKQHLLVKFAKWYEEFLGRYAHSNICVTRAMQQDLKRKGVSSVVMYDRPPERFKPTNPVEQNSLFTRLSEKYPVFKCDKGTISTYSLHSAIALREDRPAFVVSSTSWTEDEDFSLLLDALDAYEIYKENDASLPKVVCIITGKGPQKEYYTNIISQKQWQNVMVVTPWLEADDYPLILGSCDVGVCLHTSSSGLDLPMKVVDMFGCGLPVCAVDFKCLSELVKHEHNGLVFHTSEQLAEQLKLLLTGFPKQNVLLKKFRANLEEFRSVRWQEAWQKSVAPLIVQ